MVNFHFAHNLCYDEFIIDGVLLASERDPDGFSSGDDDSSLSGFVVPDSQATDEDEYDEESQVSVGRDVKQALPSTPPSAQVSLDDVYDAVNRESFLRRKRKRKQIVSSDPDQDQDETLSQYSVNYKCNLLADIGRSGLLPLEREDILQSAKSLLQELSTALLNVKAIFEAVEPLVGRCDQCNHCARVSSDGVKTTLERDYMSAQDGSDSDDSDIPIKRQRIRGRRL